VPVSLHVPSLQIFESVFDKTLADVDSLVDLRLTYIGQLNETMQPYGVEWSVVKLPASMAPPCTSPSRRSDPLVPACSKHGPSECDGNVQQLCVAAHARTQKEWWNFIQCQNFQNLNKVGDVSLATQCAKVVGRDWVADFSDCYTGSEGRSLLQDSGKLATAPATLRRLAFADLLFPAGSTRSPVKFAQAANITKSATLLVNDQLVCIRDGAWKDCPSGHAPEDFKRVIRDEFNRINQQ
jgi:hypothetical protein